MNPSAKLITEAVEYLMAHGTGARPELHEIARKLEYTVTRACEVLKMEMIPGIATVMEETSGQFRYKYLHDIDDLLLQIGPSWEDIDIVEMLLLEDRWRSQDYRRIAAVTRKHGYDLCHYAASIDIELKELEAFGRHEVLTEAGLDKLTKLPLKLEQIASLMDDGVPSEKVISLTNELRSQGLRNLKERVRAAYEGHPKPLLDGVI